MKKRSILCMLLVVIMTMLSAVPAFAAGGKTDPYGFNWMDETTGKWYAQYYVYDKSENAYYIEDYVYLNGNKLFDKNGNQIISNALAMDTNSGNAEKPTITFDVKGNLYFITKDGEVCRMTDSTAATYSKATSVSNAKTFTLDADGLGIKVSSKNLSSLSFSGSYARNSSDSVDNAPVVDKSGNYVLSYVYNGDPTKMVYDAYFEDEVILSVYCKNSNVWLETEQVLLSETCVGAKFVGYSHDYFTILYDLDGTVYAFAYGDYDTALPISLGEEITSYKKDANGFIESITTVRKTYDLDALLDEYGYSGITWRDDIDYVKNTSSKSVAYDANGEKLVTLKKNGNHLYLGDEKLDNSYRSTYLGITKEGYPVWINSDGDLYYFTGSTTKFIDTNVTRLRYNEDGFVTQYVVGSKNHNLKF